MRRSVAIGTALVSRRNRVIDYVAQRYGRERVSQIITYGTMAAKAVVRDVARVQGLSYGFADSIAKLIPFELGITLDDALDKEEELRKNEAELRNRMQAAGQAPAATGAGNVKILTSCPSCLQGLTRYGDDLQNGLLEADYIVVEMARHILGEQWLPEYVERANSGGIERVLV